MSTRTKHPKAVTQRRLCLVTRNRNGFVASHRHVHTAKFACVHVSFFQFYKRNAFKLTDDRRVNQSPRLRQTTGQFSRKSLKLCKMHECPDETPIKQQAEKQEQAGAHEAN